MDKNNLAPDGFKSCRMCEEIKPVCDFYKVKNVKSGLHSWCKKCCCSQVREKQKADPEKQKKQNVRYYRDHKDRIKAKSRMWSASNHNLVISTRRRFRSKEIEELSDSYISNLLNLKKSDVPHELLEAKRLQIKIKRALKNGNYRYHKPEK